MSEADDRYSEDTVPWQIGQYRNHTPCRVGQTMLANLKGRPVVIECIQDNGWIQWRSCDLQHSGDMSPDRWDRMRTAQQEARRDEGEELSD